MTSDLIDKNRLAVTIVGGGSTAHALIPFLSGAEHFVRILTQKPMKWANEISVQYQSIYGDVINEYTGSLLKASDNPKEVIPQADVIIFCMPVNKYRLALHKVAPYLNKNKKIFIGTIYGQGGFNWMVEEIKKKYELINLSYFAIGLVPWICRIIEYGKVGVTYGPKSVNVVAVHPPDQFEFLNKVLFNDICVKWFQKGTFQQAKNFLSLTLSVDNQIIHPTRCYGLFLRYGGKWSSKEEIPLFYRDYDQLSADLLQQVDNEYSVIRKLIKSRYPHEDFRYMLDYLSLERLSYNSKNIDIRESFTSSKTLGAILTPTVKTESGEWIIDPNSRFFTDDIHYGLCIAKWIAEKLEINVPKIDNIIAWAQDVLGERIVDKGKFVIERLNKGLIPGVPSFYGYNNVDEIID